MKYYYIVLIFFISFITTCSQTRMIYNEAIDNTTKKSDTEAIMSNKTLKNYPIIIGEHETNYTLKDIRETLIFITIGDGESTDLSGIEQFQNTTSLRLTLLNEKQIDFSPLRSLPKLVSLRLGGMVNTLPDLSGIPSLKVLDLNFAKLISLDGIEKIPSLEMLFIYENRVPLTDMSALRHLKNLKSLHLYSGLYTLDFSVLTYLSELEELWLAIDGDIDLIGICQVKSIKKLFLQSNISRVLDETGGRVMYKNIEEIGKMTGLKKLYLDESIRSVEFLTGNVNLEELTLIADEERNDYAKFLLPLDVKPLSNLKKLKRLVIRGFELENIDALDALLPQLEYFSTDLYEME